MKTIQPHVRPDTATSIARRPALAKASAAKLVFLGLLATWRLPEADMEHRFHPVRKWRFDYAWPAHKVALEVEGGVFAGGRHTRGAGFAADMEKYNAAALLGWRLLRVTPDRLNTAATLEMVKAAIGK